jgi:hypothetical protein
MMPTISRPRSVRWLKLHQYVARARYAPLISKRPIQSSESYHWYQRIMAAFIRFIVKLISCRPDVTQDPAQENRAGNTTGADSATPTSESRARSGFLRKLKGRGS